MDEMEINKMIARNRELESNVVLLQQKIKIKNKKIRELELLYKKEQQKNAELLNNNKQESFNF